jgi:hypothetical protein
MTKKVERRCQCWLGSFACTAEMTAEDLKCDTCRSGCNSILVSAEDNLRGMRGLHTRVTVSTPLTEPMGLSDLLNALKGIGISE